MKELSIGRDGFSLPAELITSTQAILARKRSGKSYTASVQAEEMLAQGQQILVIDPTSAWYGLRSSSDGRGEGYAVVVFGGKHADAPLDFRSGADMARSAIDLGFSAIFDIGGWKTREQIQFVFDLCSELLRLNEAALHVFMDEADTFAPQKPNVPGQAECLGAVTRMVKQGGIKGIGFTMITQRSASISWDVLSQVDVLTILRMSAPHDLKPVHEWLLSETTPEFAKQVRSEQPSLPIGTAFIASAPLGLAQKVVIRPRRTFNSGATPKPGERKVAPKVLAKVDIQNLGAKIAASIQTERENSPEFLKNRIAELEAAARKVTTNSITPERERMLVQQLNEARNTASAYEKLMATIYKQSEDIQNAAGKMREAIDDIRCDTNKTPVITFTGDTPPPLVDTHKLVKRILTGSKMEPIAKNLRSGAERMLAVCAQWYPHGRSEAQIAAQVGMKRTGGTWAAYKSDLRKAGYIVIDNGRWTATDEGVAYLGNDVPRSPSSTQEMLALWESNLRSGAVSMLKALVAHRGKAITREQLGSEVNMEPRGGTFSAYLSDLKSAELIIVEGSQVRANKETLFL